MDMGRQREAALRGYVSDTARDTAAMDLKSITDQAKRLIDKRGGSKALKEDADELADIARGGGSVSDKAKAAADALKDPGAKGPEGEPRSS
jgi:hypothetical protein